MSIYLSIYLSLVSSGRTSIGLSGSNDLTLGANPGYLHMAAAILAMQDFTTRNTSIVRNLDQLLANCSLEFAPLVLHEYNSNSAVDRSHIFNSDSQGHLAAQTLFAQERVPSSIAGPFYDAPALDLAAMALAANLPLVTHGSYNVRVLHQSYSPTSGQTFPDFILTSHVALHYLTTHPQMQRSNYIAILYPFNDDGFVRRQVLERVMDSLAPMVLDDDDENDTNDANKELLPRLDYESHSYPTMITIDQRIFESNQKDSSENILWKGTVQSLSRIQQRGFKTIVLTLMDPIQELPRIANAAAFLEMIPTSSSSSNDSKDTDNHHNAGANVVWMLVGPMTGLHLLEGLTHDNVNITNLLYGSTWITGMESMFYERFLRAYRNSTTNNNIATESVYALPRQDPFFLHMSNQGADFVALCNAANPMKPGEEGYFVAPNDFFTKLPEMALGMGFLYDAVMSIGIGACRAQQLQQNTITNTSVSSTITGDEHLQGIRQVQFHGATGPVRYQQGGSFPGARDWNTVPFGIFNLLPQSPLQSNATTTNHSTTTTTTTSTTTAGVRSLDQVPFQLTDIFVPDFEGSWTNPLDVLTNGEWISLQSVIFPDGSTTSPRPLRTIPSTSYLSEGLRIFGFCLFGMVVVSVLLVAIWVFVKRDHRVVRAAQPHFLYMLLFGCVVFSSAILPLSFDERTGWTPEQLGGACMSLPWLISMGHLITFCALFSKLWRVNKVLQFARRVVSIRQVAAPAIILVLLSILILSLWTWLNPLNWMRVPINTFTGESIGQCSGDYMVAYIVPLAVVVFIPTLLTGVMAWKTKDVDDAYAESWWIFMLFLVQIELLIIGVPVISILRNLSTDGRYVGYIIILWAIPMSTMALIMMPKALAYHKAVHGGSSDRNKRGQRSGVHVSGISGSGTMGNPAGKTSAVSNSSGMAEHYHTSRQDDDEVIVEGVSGNDKALIEASDEAPSDALSSPSSKTTGESAASSGQVRWSDQNLNT